MYNHIGLHSCIPVALMPNREPAFGACYRSSTTFTLGVRNTCIAVNVLSKTTS